MLVQDSQITSASKSAKLAENGSAFIIPEFRWQLVLWYWLVIWAFLAQNDFLLPALSCNFWQIAVKVQSKQSPYSVLDSNPFFIVGVLFYFQEKLNKGAELYKEEIDNLKTQLVRYDMDRMKQSKIFDMQ